MSRSKAIADFCKMCIFDPKSGMGTWRQQTESCPSVKSCPLWPYRPKSASSETLARGPDNELGK